MDYIITVADTAKSAGLARALAAYNARNPALSEGQFVQRLIDGQLDSLVQAYVTTTVTRLAFLQRFTAEERLAIRAAAETNAVIEDYLQMLDMSEEVDVTHALTTAGVQALEAAGLIALGRAADILAL